MDMWVYIVWHRLSLKCYVGITRSSLEERWARHIQNANLGTASHLYNAIRRYGVSSFEICALSAAETWEELCLLEKHFIAKYRSNDNRYGYNMTEGGEGVVATDEVRKKIRDSKLGIPRPIGVRQKISRALNGRKVGVNAKPRPILWVTARNESRRENRRLLREAGLVRWGGNRNLRKSEKVQY